MRTVGTTVFKQWVILLLTVWIPGGSLFAFDSDSADEYAFRLLDDYAVEVSVTGIEAVRFEPEFTVLYTEERILQVREQLTLPRYRVAAWRKPGAREVTKNQFEAATPYRLRADSAELSEDGAVRWSFPEHPDFELVAGLRPSEEVGEPQLWFRMTAKKQGYYSVGYTGAPELEPQDAEGVFQPLVWHERRFPEDSYLTLEYNCSIPGTLVSRGGTTYGVLADPGSLPFRVPTLRNNLFGVTVRNGEGRAQPMVFAPVLGGDGSELEPGDSVEFDLLLVVRPGGWNETVEYIARSILGFRDYRENTLNSLNETFENMIDYGMSEYSRFLIPHRGSSYATDMPGAVKNVSALDPFGVSLVVDDEAIFTERAKPIMEYLLSREKFLFSPLGEVGAQIATSNLRGPSATVSELAELYGLSRQRVPVFLHHVNELYGVDRVLNMEKITYGGTWQRDLALYRATGDETHLAEASRKANDYIRERIENPPSHFEEAIGTSVEAYAGHFWDDILPAWVELFELYEITGDPRHLDAAVHGARQHASIVWFYPRIPDKEIVVNEGGTAPLYRRGEPIAAPETSVPAWRVSEMGLIAEGIGTAGGAHRGLFLTTYAPYFLRLAQHSGDNFLREIARSAVVGRYSNFPGYHMNLAYSTAHEAPDFPLRAHGELTSTSMHYNHVWVHTRMILDYLVADAFDRTGGAVDFPSRFVEGYAFLYGRIYGDEPGHFYEDENVQLWMPRGILTTDDVQANYITATGNGNLYVVLKNQADREIEVTVDVNDDVVAGARGAEYPVRVWQDNQRAEDDRLLDGRVRVRISPRGVTAFAVDGLAGNPEVPRRLLADGEPLSEQSFGWADSPIGAIQGMYVGTPAGTILSFGEKTWVFGYLEGHFEDLTEMDHVTFHYRTDGGEWQEVTVPEYPWDFDAPMAGDSREFEFHISTQTPASKQDVSEELILRR